MITSIILKFNNNNNPSQNPQRSPDPLLGGAIGDLPTRELALQIHREATKKFPSCGGFWMWFNMGL